MNKGSIWLLVLMGLLMILPVAQLNAETAFRKYAGEFMEIEVSARAQAMGGAFSPISDDVFAIYYNPAGLTQINYPQLSFTHTQQFISSINHDFIGFSRPLSNNKYLGLGLIRLGVDDILDSRSAGILYEKELKNIDVSKLKKFSTYDYVLFLALGQQFNDKISGGLNVKLIRRKLLTNKANGIGADAGLMYQVTPQWKIALAAHNITATLISWSSGEKNLVSPTYRLGSSYVFYLKSLNSEFVPTFNTVIRSQKTLNLAPNALSSKFWSSAFGGEFILKKRLSFRAGFDELQRWAMGIGIHIPHIRVDYAFTAYSGELGNAQRISLLLDFNKQRNPAP